ncbi:MAG TPA: hypothetical protein VE977_00940, partial [Pyrinomonadaceae bacterium]|nr:hypothetical protein [Pyrinomonadaceae bacterium]
MTFEQIKGAILELFARRKTLLEKKKATATDGELREIARIDELLKKGKDWLPDSDWLTALPSLLCGPIVRKVLPEEVTVFVALKAAAEVKLSVFERKSDGQKGNEILSASQ